jgi:hypothetical protein
VKNLWVRALGERDKLPYVMLSVDWFKIKTGLPVLMLLVMDEFVDEFRVIVKYSLLSKMFYQIKKKNESTK